MRLSMAILSTSVWRIQKSWPTSALRFHPPQMLIGRISVGKRPVTYKDSANVEQTWLFLHITRHLQMPWRRASHIDLTTTDTALVVSPVLTLSDNSINGQVTLTQRLLMHLSAKVIQISRMVSCKAILLRFANLLRERTSGLNTAIRQQSFLMNCWPPASVSILKDAGGPCNRECSCWILCWEWQQWLRYALPWLGRFCSITRQRADMQSLLTSHCWNCLKREWKGWPLTMAFTPIGYRPDFHGQVGRSATGHLSYCNRGKHSPIDRTGCSLSIHWITIPRWQDLQGEYLQGTGAAAVSQVVSSKSTVVQGGALGITTTMQMAVPRRKLPWWIWMVTDSLTSLLVVLSNTPIHKVDWVEKSTKGIGANNSDNASEAWGYGGNPVASVSDITKFYLRKSKSSAQNQQSSWLAQFSISGSVPKNTDDL